MKGQIIKIVKWIAIGVTIGLLLFVGYASTKPDSMTIKRSTSIHASQEKIFPLINDFHSWTLWSPYEKLDPALKRTYSGSESGKGAIYQWEGDDKVGSGRMEIRYELPPSDAKTQSIIDINLVFLKPVECHNTASFTLTPEGDNTSVEWAMHCKSDLTSKVMQCFFDVDKFVGKDFDVGLANLKAVVEKPTKK